MPTQALLSAAPKRRSSLVGLSQAPYSAWAPSPSAAQSRARSLGVPGGGSGSETLARKAEINVAQSDE
jgi:hypothetical protein